MHSLEASNLINGKSNREPGMKRAGETSGYGFMFTSTTSVTLLCLAPRDFFGWRESAE